MPESVRSFYDRLAGSYHLTYPDWRNDVRRQGAVLDRRIRATMGDGPFRILDAACGIGTQAIGLAARGHTVTATDVSAASVERAATEAKEFGVDLATGVADVRDLPSEYPGPFDVVLACDNLFAHLLDDAELEAAAAALHAVTAAGGLFMASLQDYDEALLTRARASTPKVFEGPEGTRVVQTLADWSEDGRTYAHTLMILRREGEDWHLEHHTTTERALRRDDLTKVLGRAGFGQIRWHSTSETGFFQPVVTARPG